MSKIQTQQLQDLMEVRRSFNSVLSRKIVFSVFYRPKVEDLADLYFCIAMFILASLAWFVFEVDWPFLLTAAVPAIVFAPLAIKTLRKQYPFLSENRDLAEEYRSDWQYLRFWLFSEMLRKKGLSIDRVKELRGLLKLESELTNIRQSIISTHPSAVILTLLIGLLAGMGGMEKFWGEGYGVVAVVALAVALYFVYGFLQIFPPKSYLQKELEIFVEWYCTKLGTNEIDRIGDAGTIMK